MFRVLLTAATTFGLLLGQAMCCCAFRSSSSQCSSAGDCCCQGQLPQKDQPPHDCPCKSKRQFVDVSGPVLTQVDAAHFLLTWWLDLSNAGLPVDAVLSVDWEESLVKSPLPLRLDPVALAQILRC